MAFTKQHIRIMLIAVLCHAIHGDAEQIGVNYGTLGDNLPSAAEVVALVKNNNIGKMRIFEANRAAIKALANSNIDLIVGVGNQELSAIAAKQDSANTWVNENIVPFYPATNIISIAVGNEILGTKASAQYVSDLLPAMSNIQTALENAGLQNSIKVSTSHAVSVLGTSFPPSTGTFSDQVKDTMASILQFLEEHGSPFLANVYPYFSYIGNKNQISLDYALFKSTSPVVRDGDRSYTNLFDSMVDSLLSAMEALGHPNLPIVITESGWPSEGREEATIDNARTYNNNLIKHVLSNAGTPKRPGSSIETYIFALFNENQKAGDETERHFGLFYPSKQPVYAVNLSPSKIATTAVSVVLILEFT